MTVRNTHTIDASANEGVYTSHEVVEINLTDAGAELRRFQRINHLLAVRTESETGD